MSGGRFDYKDEYAMGEIFGYCDEEHIPNVFEDREISELIYDVFNLIHDYDWYASADTGKEDYLKAKAKFKKKWFGTKRGLQIKRIVDDTIEHTREELYEIFGLKEQENEIIVHCKDCKYAHRLPEDLICKRLTYELVDRTRKETDYCSMGERKK